MSIERRPTASDLATKQRMQLTRQRDTTAELALRRELHRLGLRYRVQKRPLREVRRTADIVFGPTKVAVFVDGCYWHGCPTHGTWPRANAAWWRAKIEANMARDRETDALLLAEDWLPMRVWEHENPADAARRIKDVVDERRRAVRGSSSAVGP